MTLDLTCTECEASFELDVKDLLETPKRLDCPNCEAKAPARRVEALAGALDDLMKSMKELAPKFGVSVTAETDDLLGKNVSASSDDEDEDDEVDEDVDDDDDGEIEDDESDEDEDDELEFDR